MPVQTSRDVHFALHCAVVTGSVSEASGNAKSRLFASNAVENRPIAPLVAEYTISYVGPSPKAVLLVVVVAAGASVGLGAMVASGSVVEVVVVAVAVVVDVNVTVVLVVAVDDVDVTVVSVEVVSVVRVAVVVVVSVVVVCVPVVVVDVVVVVVPVAVVELLVVLRPQKPHSVLHACDTRTAHPPFDHTPSPSQRPFAIASAHATVVESMLGTPSSHRLGFDASSPGTNPSSNGGPK